MACGSITIKGEGTDPVAVAGMDPDTLKTLVDRMPRNQWRAVLSSIEHVSIGLADTEDDLNGFLRDHTAFFRHVQRRDPDALQRLQIAAAGKRHEKGWRAVKTKHAA